jgi:hypothetical protein
MEDRMTTVDGDRQALIDPVYPLADRIISVLMIIVWIGGLTTLILLAAYIYALFGLAGDARTNVVGEIRLVMLTMWEKLLPIGMQVLKFIAPVVIILLAVLGVRTLMRSGASPLNLSGITSDLPSVLAVIIVVTICLLPLAGLGVAEVLKNIALVVVGFYFGKREANASVQTPARP